LRGFNFEHADFEILACIYFHNTCKEQQILFKNLVFFNISRGK